jgi:predicted DNA-binding transcriptional regulator AlpA
MRAARESFSGISIPFAASAAFAKGRENNKVANTSKCFTIVLCEKACPPRRLPPSPMFKEAPWALGNVFKEKMITSRCQVARGKVIMMPAKNDSPFLSAEEIARLLGFSVRTVTLWFNQWRDSGGQQGIPGFKVGKSWRAERKEIEAWIETQKVRAIQPTTIPLRQAR